MEVKNNEFGVSKWTDMTEKGNKVSHLIPVKAVKK